MKKLLNLIKRFIVRRSQRRESESGAIEMSPEVQVEIEKRRGPRWPL